MFYTYFMVEDLAPLEKICNFEGFCLGNVHILLDICCQHLGIYVSWRVSVPLTFFTNVEILSSKSHVLKVICPQSRLSSKSSVLKVVCPQSRVLKVAVLKVVCPQSPTGQTNHNPTQQFSFVRSDPRPKTSLL